MSQEALEAVLEQMKTDDAFRREVLELPGEQARASYLHERGYDCTADEVAALSRVGDQTLEDIAGGGNSMTQFGYSPPTL